ncbi:hypothetical protein PMIN01_11745 [Paraphaeosphaeria minitans]|uniref:Uncharacterized protein n=1 Tax=Paraphaeosphaeria minitans TaxID=565426 RepID=A0A9P6G659_9PLEO|nr:hypothetical protein PMIN01_11745 [Paraphaeosphaeria minitans]
MGEEDTLIHIPGSKLCEYLLRQIAKKSKHWASMSLPGRSRSGNGRKHLRKRLGQEMKQDTPRKRREQRSAWIMTWIIRINHELRAFQTRIISIVYEANPFAATYEQNCDYVVCLSCISRRRDARCISICFVVPLPLITFPISSLNPYSHTCSSGSSRGRKSGAIRGGK